MQEKKRRVVRDPYFYWKLVNMALACAVLVLAFLILSGRGERYLMPAAFFLGVVRHHGAGKEQKNRGLSLLRLCGASGGRPDSGHHPDMDVVTC